MKLTENTLRELIRKELISLEEGITEAKSNLKTLLGTSEDESIGRKIRLGGKRDPGQEVWQKVDGKFWMNLKTKKKLDLNKWAKHADGFHMSDKDLQFESKVNESVTEGAPKMAKNEEAENIQELMNQIANAQKGGGSGRYGKEFEKAKTKALRAIKDMVTYAKIGR
jgi:hypothetical protein